MDVLQNVEARVVGVWGAHPEMNNYAVARAYEVAAGHYRAVARQQEPKPVHLSGLDAVLFETIKEMCDRRLGLRKGVDLPDLELTPIPTEDMVACLRRLRKSVDFWTQQGGRRGYLEYIQRFVG